MAPWALLLEQLAQNLEIGCIGWTPLNPSGSLKRALWVTASHNNWAYLFLFSYAVWSRNTARTHAPHAPPCILISLSQWPFPSQLWPTKTNSWLSVCLVGTAYKEILTPASVRVRTLSPSTAYLYEGVQRGLADVIKRRRARRAAAEQTLRGKRPPSLSIFWSAVHARDGRLQ